MKTHTKIVDMDAMKVTLSTVWICIMFNMAFADILGFINPGALQEIMTSTDITQGFLLVAALLVEIPIAMILLSRILTYRANRWANIIAGVITILWVIGGGNTSLSYLFFATIEVVCLGFIVWSAWTWPPPSS